jgi:hypothetical protein
MNLNDKSIRDYKIQILDEQNAIYNTYNIDAVYNGYFLKISTDHSFNSFSNQRYIIISEKGTT